MKLMSYLCAVLLLFTSCEENREKQPSTPLKSNLIITDTIDLLPDTSVITSSFTLLPHTDSFSLNGISWMEVEIGGDPDTALCFYTYRCLFIDNKKADDCEIGIHLIEHAPTIKKLMPELFDGHLDKNTISALINNFIKSTIDHAQKQVDADMVQYGISDGPCYDLLQQVNTFNIK